MDGRSYNLHQFVDGASTSVLSCLAFTDRYSSKVHVSCNVRGRRSSLTVLARPAKHQLVEAFNVFDGDIEVGQGTAAGVNVQRLIFEEACIENDPASTKHTLTGQYGPLSNSDLLA